MAEKTSITPTSTSEGYVRPQWSGITRNIMMGFVIVALVFLLVVLSPIFQVLFLAFVFALIIYLPARWLSRHTPISYPLAVVILYVVLVVLLVFAVLIVVPALIDGINTLLDSLSTAYNNFVVALENYQPGDAVVEILGFTVDLDPLIQPLQNLVLGQQPETTDTSESGAPRVENLSLAKIVSAALSLIVSVTHITAGFIVSVVGFVVTFGFALFISFLLLIDLPSLGTALPGWVHPGYGREVQLLLAHIDDVWEGFLKGEVIVGGLQAISAYIIFTFLGVPGAAFLAFLDGTLGMIPSIGGILAGIPVAVICLFLGSTRFPDMSNVTFTILVFVINGIVTQVIFTFVSPLIMSKQVKLPTLVIIIGVTLGLVLGGILGALLVVPLMSSIKLIMSYILAKLSDREPFPDEEVTEAESRGFFSQMYQNRKALAAPTETA